MHVIVRKYVHFITKDRFEVGWGARSSGETMQNLGTDLIVKAFSASYIWIFIFGLPITFLLTKAPLLGRGSEIILQETAMSLS